MTSTWKKVLELTKLVAETITALAPIIKMILVATGAMALAFMVSTNKFGAKEAQYLAEMREYKVNAEIASQYADSMAVEVVRQQTIAKAAQARATTAQQQAGQSLAQTATLVSNLAAVRDVFSDSVELARVIIPKQDSVITQQEITIAFQDTAILNLNAVIVSKDTTINFLTLSRDSLQTVVDNIPEPPPPPPFPRITRKHALIGGMIVGFAAKVFLFK